MTVPVVVCAGKWYTAWLINLPVDGTKRIRLLLVGSLHMSLICALYRTCPLALVSFAIRIFLLDLLINIRAESAQIKTKKGEGANRVRDDIAFDKLQLCHHTPFFFFFISLFWLWQRLFVLPDAYCAHTNELRTVVRHTHGRRYTRTDNK